MAKVFTMKMTASETLVHGAGWVTYLASILWEPEEDVKIIGWTTNYGIEIPGFDAGDFTLEFIYQLSQRADWANEGPTPGVLDERRMDLRQLFTGTSAQDELRNQYLQAVENDKTVMLPKGEYISIKEGEEVVLHLHGNNSHATVDSLLGVTAILYYLK